MKTFDLLLIIGLAFGSLGAAMAYLITYKEWQRHYPTPEVPRKIAREAALFTFIFFLAVMVLVGLVFK